MTFRCTQLWRQPPTPLFDIARPSFHATAHCNTVPSHPTHASAPFHHTPHTFPLQVLPIRAGHFPQHLPQAGRRHRTPLAEDLPHPSAHHSWFTTRSTDHSRTCLCLNSAAPTPPASCPAPHRAPTPPACIPAPQRHLPAPSRQFLPGLLLRSSLPLAHVFNLLSTFTEPNSAMLPGCMVGCIRHSYGGQRLWRVCVTSGTWGRQRRAAGRRPATATASALHIATWRRHLLYNRLHPIFALPPSSIPTRLHGELAFVARAGLFDATAWRGIANGTDFSHAFCGAERGRLPAPPHASPYSTVADGTLRTLTACCGSRIALPALPLPPSLHTTHTTTYYPYFAAFPLLGGLSGRHAGRRRHRG